MLVLTRKAGETIWIDEDVEIIISEVKGEQVKLLLMHQEVLKLSAVNLDKIFPLQIQKQQKAI